MCPARSQLHRMLLRDQVVCAGDGRHRDVIACGMSTVPSSQPRVAIAMLPHYEPPPHFKSDHAAERLAECQVINLRLLEIRAPSWRG